MSSGATGLAGRYAGALYALAVESKKIDAIHADLTALAGLVAEHQDLKKLVDSLNSLAERYRRCLRWSRWNLPGADY